MNQNLMSIELTDSQFKKISQLVYQICGINLKDGKEALVRARLMKRLRALKVANFDDYLKIIENDQKELSSMVDVMTTNKTNFFRENAHFDYLNKNILPVLKDRKIRFWTAACSSGEEPYSLAILIKENLPNLENRDVKILATDISIRMLEKAQNGIYSEEAIKDIPNDILNKYFTKTQNNRAGTDYLIKDNIRSIVKFARLNLMEKWPMKGPFNVIFCRNVMIYFDRQTQQKLVNRFWELLEPGGYLFVGHSEGLSAISHNFIYVKPAIYKK